MKIVWVVFFTVGILILLGVLAYVNHNEKTPQVLQNAGTSDLSEKEIAGQLGLNESAWEKLSPEEKKEIISRYRGEDRAVVRAGGAGGSGGGESNGGGTEEDSSGGGETNLCADASSYTGTCKITSITRTYVSENQVLLGFGLAINESDKGYEVLFQYSTPGNEDISVGVHSLLIRDKIYPNQAYLDKYSISPGKEISCQVTPPAYGECAISSFTMNGIDLNDDSVFSIHP